MGAILNGKEIHGAYLNGKILFEENNDNDLWYECPDNGKSYSDFTGKTLMKYDDTSGTAQFLTNANTVINTSVSRNTERLAITLPNGFTFGKKGSSFYVYDNQLNKYVFDEKFVDNKMYITIPIDSATGYYLSPDISRATGLYGFIQATLSVLKD